MLAALGSREVGGIIISSSRRGPVAQLGARLTGSQKVRGSNPLGSTKLPSFAQIGIFEGLRNSLSHQDLRRGPSATKCLAGALNGME